MNVLVSAIEVGSVRALIPVCIKLLKNSEMLFIENKGHFLVEVIEELTTSLTKLPEDQDELKNFIRDNSISTVLFSVNIHDPRPLKIARLAQSMGVKTIHLLDYWNGYRSRMEIDGEKMFLPDRYLVPDEYAKKKALEEGIPGALIMVVGQPAFADTESNYKKVVKQKGPLDKAPYKGKEIVLFASEPVAHDQGKSLQENKNYRGYTEKDILKILYTALKNTDKKFFLVILPHPRQNIQELETIWQALGGELYGVVTSKTRGRDLLPFVSGVAGMASTLLYEAWMVGIPVLSIQPNLLNDSYRMMQNKNNVTFIDKNEFSIQTTEGWLKSIFGKNQHTFHSDLYLHADACKAVIKEMNL